jgi:hypothetical protein
VAARALATDQGGIVDDDLAYVTPWGCDQADKHPSPVHPRCPGPAHAQLARHVAGAALPHGGTVSTPGRRTRLDPQTPASWPWTGSASTPVTTEPDLLCARQPRD